MTILLMSFFGLTFQATAAGPALSSSSVGSVIPGSPVDDVIQMIASGDPRADFNQDGQVTQADFSAWIANYHGNNGNTNYYLNGDIFPSAFFSQGFVDPVVTMTGPQLDSNGNYRMNGCQIGANLISLVQSADHDFAISLCEAAADDSGLFAFKENGVTKYLEFGGLAGHYADHNMTPFSGSIAYENPYFPFPSNVTSQADRLAYPKCDATKGFVTHQIAGSWARDYAMFVCYAKRNSPSEAAYPDKLYGGIVPNENDCPSGFNASKIRGTIGNGYGLDPSYQQDPDLYLCHGDRDGDSTGDKPVEILNFVLKGILTDGSIETVQNLGLPNSSTAIDVTLNSTRYSSYAIETRVNWQGQLATPAMIPAGSAVPFRIDFTNSGPGLIGRASGSDYLPPYHAAGDTSITIPVALFSPSTPGIHLITATPARTDTTPSQYGTNSSLGDAQQIRINFVNPGGGLDPDTLPPTVPSNLSLTSATTTSLSLSWSPSTDTPSTTQVVSGVKGYKVSVNGTLGSTVYTNTQATINGLSAGVTYQIAVRAIDNANNQSALSPVKNYSTESGGDGSDGETDDAGFSVFTPSSDTKIYYVSSSHANANDSNAGTSESAPLKTINKGLEKMRSGYPDWVLLKRGDTFTVGTTIDVTKSGRSASQKARIGAYGSGARPILNGTTKPFWLRDYTKYLVVEGLHFRNAGGAAYGVDMLGVGYEDIRLEDLLVEGFNKDNLRLDNQNAKITASGTIPYRNIHLFRVVSIDASGQSHSQGFYAMGVQNLTLEECIIDRNGWDAGVGRSTATEYAHNIYLQRDRKGDLTAPKILRSVITRGSSHGVQSRNGGLVEDSLFSGNAIGILVGNENTHDNEVPVSAIVRNNVLLDPVNINASDNGGMGIDFQGLKQGTIENNIISNIKQEANQLEAYGIRGNSNQTQTKNVTLQNNINFQSGSIKIDPSVGTLTNVLFRNNDFVDQRTSPARFVNFRTQAYGVPSFANNRYRPTDPRPYDIIGTLLSFANWRAEYDNTGVEFNPSYPAPTRNLNTYAGTIGLSNEGGFYNRLRVQRKGNWDNRLMAPVINDYIRAGFGR